MRLSNIGAILSTPTVPGVPTPAAQPAPSNACPPGIDGMVPQVVDGFSYNASLLYLPYRYYPNALAQMDVLRRANNMRPRWFCVPDEKDLPIAGYDTLYYQINATDQSYFWGYSFASISATDPNGDPAETTAQDLCVQCVDDCTGIPLWLDFACGGGLHSNGTARVQPTLLTNPRIILDPALVNVQISNRTENAINCQLLLLFAEPCKVVDECAQQRVWARRIQAGAAK